MAACTLQDVRELHAKLLTELRATLREEILVELKGVLDHGHANGVTELEYSSEPGSPGDRKRHKGTRRCSSIGEETELAIQEKMFSQYAAPKPHENGVAQRDSIIVAKDETEWKADFWATNDETEWLLSTPFGPAHIPGQTDSLLCSELELGMEDEDELDESPHHNDPNSPWRFVERDWFLKFSAGVIILNIMLGLITLNDPTLHDTLYLPNQLMLGFYVFELVARISFFKTAYLQGPRAFVIGNILDLLVVCAGVFEQWVVPLFPNLLHGKNLMTTLKVMRTFRLLRVLKIIRVFLSSDLGWTEEPTFQSFIGGVIAFNAILMGFETDLEWCGWYWIEQVLLVIYVFELSVRIKRFGCYFISCSNPDCVWNWLDVVIVLSSVLDSWIMPISTLLMRRAFPQHYAEEEKEAKSGMGLGQVMMMMRMLRLMRILRLAKLVKSVRPLYILVVSVCAAVQGVVWVLVLTLATLYAMGIFATKLIGQGLMFQDLDNVEYTTRFPFRSVSNSMFTLFRLMSGSASEAESDAIDAVMEDVPPMKFAFIFFMVTSSWTLLSILTAVVSETMISTTAVQEYELKLSNAESDRAAYTSQLRELFHDIDQSNDGYVSWEELMNYLKEGDNAFKTAKMCGVPVRDVVQVLKTVEGSNLAISCEHFVECLADVSNHVTEKSIMKLESRLKDLHKVLLQSLQEV